ncbi:MAG TPA: VOC family protein [Thermoleophilaceae bacterium]|jgi:hypothetical protein
MSERNGFQPGVPSWVDTWQPDADAAAAFYTELFGWEAEDTMPPEVPGRHFMCRLRDRDVAAIASRPGSAPDQTAWGTYVQVENVEEAAERARAAGGSVLMEPFDALDGGRIAVLADPAGAAIGVWQPERHRGAELVNEPGAWAMSALATPDPDAAKAFYARVFGWETDDFGPVTIWRLPGYVGGEPDQPVPRDVVAVMTPGDSAAWMVNFWVDDVERTASHAEELGGRVLSPPAADGVGVTAVLADPQGAAFSVSRVVPR